MLIRSVVLYLNYLDSDFHPLPYSERYQTERVDLLKKRPIVIGGECFWGANSIILKYYIGKEYCGGCRVSGIFPNNVIIAGNSAEVIKAYRE